MKKSKRKKAEQKKSLWHQEERSSCSCRVHTSGTKAQFISSLLEAEPDWRTDCHCCMTSTALTRREQSIRSATSSWLDLDSDEWLLNIPVDEADAQGLNWPSWQVFPSIPSWLDHAIRLLLCLFLPVNWGSTQFFFFLKNLCYVIVADDMATP